MKAATASRAFAIAAAIGAAAARRTPAPEPVEEPHGYVAGAEESAEAQNRTATGLEKTAAELADLRERTAELERMLKDVG